MSNDIPLNISLNQLPQHVAIIMDGNGRWAKKQGMLRTFGHKHSLKAVRSAIETCNELNIPFLTLYAFSSENWSRPRQEVNLLMDLLVRSLKKETKTFIKNNIRLKTIGDIEDLPPKVYTHLKEVVEKTKDNTGSTLILALSYGAKNEIVAATKRICMDVQEGRLNIDDLNIDSFKNYLYTTDIPDVDLMIRTSGECRISNFMLWQIAYAELYFTDVLWPDFGKDDFYKAIKDYQRRERRFGKTGEQISNEQQS